MPFYLGRKAIRKVPGTVIKAAPIPKPEVIEGFGTREQAGALCESAGFQSALLVTDDTIFGLGLHEKVTASLEKHGVACTIFHDIHSEPTVEIVEAGRRAAAECGADCIIALGGGSVMDSGKIIAAGARHPLLPIQHYLHKFAIAEGGTLPMINIPSTAGIADEQCPPEKASDLLLLALKNLLEKCGLEQGCDLLQEKDYEQLTDMINADSINYSPSRTFTDNEIRMLLDQIRRGY